MAGCSTFDDFIFEDHAFGDDHVLIIGGGISGLSLAYNLRRSKTQYRLFEGSAVLGGRVRSQDGFDYGASVFEQSDVELKKMIKEFNLSEVPLTNQSFYLAGGAESLIHAIKERVSGLMPYRSVRLKWKLREIRKISKGYDLHFESPAGRRVLRAQKIALTLPPSQWGRVIGLLDLPEMAWAKSWLSTLSPESILKVHYTVPAGVLGNSYRKGKVMIGTEKEKMNLVVKNLKGNLAGLEFEVFNQQGIDKDSWIIQNEVPSDIEKIVSQINLRTKLGLNIKKMAADSFFNWTDVDLIQSAYFKNEVSLPEITNSGVSDFQIFGDYSDKLRPHTVEGALREASRVASLFV